MTFPTALTLLRIPLTFLLMALLFTPGWIAKAAAVVCFVLASATDWLDGYLARRWHQTSPLGALLDPIADKVLILGAFLAFVQLRFIPAWMVLIVVLREFLITGVRLVAASRPMVLSAVREGKQKMISQVVTVLVMLIVLLVQEGFGQGSLSTHVTQAMHGTVLGCMWITLVLTVISGTTFFSRHWRLLRDAVGQ